ncbi:hypothetical protein ACFL3E_02450 [Patescibacteria group bacterium]
MVSVNIRDRIVEVLEKGYLLSLGTSDSGGVWVADVIYVFDKKLNIYWMSNPTFRHSQAILEHCMVAGTITVSKSHEDDLGIQLTGVAEQIKGVSFALIKQHLRKRGRKVPKRVIDILLEEYHWYRLTPIKIELIDEKNFGFSKQELCLK